MRHSTLVRDTVPNWDSPFGPESKEYYPVRDGLAVSDLLQIAPTSSDIWDYLGCLGYFLGIPPTQTGGSSRLGNCVVCVV